MFSPILCHLWECFISCTKPPEKRIPKKTVHVRVKMDCEGCVRKVTNAVEDLEGMESFVVNQKLQRVSVTGNVDAQDVLDELGEQEKMLTWAYDMKAPTGFVRNVPQAVGDPKSPEMKMMVLFNDDNPNACSIM
ncbi:heavy metal-associated isoprenylated plant protein [Trifolium repens]|nr:heavy metal-associated isoprenylated plant protein [Trifolium repens]